jgi:hypothetical protein
LEFGELTYRTSGVDNVIQITIVTSNGEHLTVNSHLHPDLFWALRGGGGGTFGVITSVTYLTHPIIPIIAASFTANMTNPTVAKTLVTESVRIIPHLSDAGWSGHGIIAGRNIFEFVYLAPGLSWAQANTSIDPFFSFAHNLTPDGLVIERAVTTLYDSFYDWYMAFYGTDGDDGHNTEIGSRLLPRDVFEDYETVAEVFLQGQVNWMYVNLRSSLFPLQLMVIS